MADVCVVGHLTRDRIVIDGGAPRAQPGGVVYYCAMALRRLGLRHTQFATATAGTIRSRLLKIGPLVTVSVRRCLVRMARAYPYQSEFALACLRLGHQAA